MKKIAIRFIILAVITTLLLAACGDKKPDYTAMIRIDGGTFTMGSPDTEAERETDEGPQRQVTLTGFWMSKYPVTQGWFEEVMGFNPSYFKGKNLPVECVTWFDALEFCNKLSELHNLQPVYNITGKIMSDNHIWEATVTADFSKSGYRLPTEAQWEYACRAGTTTPFNTGENITTSQANYNGNKSYNGNPAGVYRDTTTPVDMFSANAWGLYDMHGNVSEWCWDLFSRTYYGESGNNNDPEGPRVGIVRRGNPGASFRVVRGGSYDWSGQRLRSAFRADCAQDIGFGSLGFRVVRSLESE